MSLMTYYLTLTLLTNPLKLPLIPCVSATEQICVATHVSKITTETC